jgi:dihydroorotate dehydrogenase
LAFDGWGWVWDYPLRWAGLLDPKLFSVVMKTITLGPRKDNLRWWKPWDCVSLLPDGSVVNRVGLTNPGSNWWFDEVGPRVNNKKTPPLIGSIQGTRSELLAMAVRFNDIDIDALEINASCPNTGHPFANTPEIIGDVKAVKAVSRHPLITKVSVVQDYASIALGLYGIAEAMSFNSVPWRRLHPADHDRSPLWRLEDRLNDGGGGGGVSGRAAQKENWTAVWRLKQLAPDMPTICPSIMSWDDIERAYNFGASAISFGAIHLPTKNRPWTLFTNPCKPTWWVRRLNREQRKERPCATTRD